MTPLPTRFPRRAQRCPTGGRWRWLAAAALFLLPAGASATAAPPITAQSLLAEMVDRSVAARWPDPPYVCSQFSSYDRRSRSPDDPEGWFANDDHGQYLRTMEAGGRTEYVMADAQGPGAIVRIWSPNPKGTIRIYLDGAATPTLEAPMADLLSGHGGVPPPLAYNKARGWNLYLPIPYATRCVVTAEEKDLYYQVNVRTWPKGTAVTSFAAGDLERLRAAMNEANTALARPGPLAPAPSDPPRVREQGAIPPGESRTVEIPAGDGGGAIRGISLRIAGRNAAQVRRSTLLSAEFDGEACVWSPAGAFFGADVLVPKATDWWTSVLGDSQLQCRWVMPFRKRAVLTLTNGCSEVVTFDLIVDRMAWTWDDRSMHFHATWRQEFPISVKGGAGTRDFTYVDVKGQGVYMGDALAVMNPVGEWWGEGDEKIRVDGEAFPSHFGTGTEDYYGFGWCMPERFDAPFNGQSRVDGQTRQNNWGHTTLRRVRSLDGIPFTRSLHFDMELWHWRACNVAYAVTCWFYARPGATVSPAPMPEEAAREIPQPPELTASMRVPGAMECETMKEVSVSFGSAHERQAAPRPGMWSDDGQLWVRGKGPGAFADIRLRIADERPRRVKLWASRSWDYGILRFTVNGTKAHEDMDMYSPRSEGIQPTGPIDLGVHKPLRGNINLRVQVIGGNPASEGNHSFFGLDCLTLEPVDDAAKPQ